MPNIYNEPLLKVIGKALLSAACFGLAAGITNRLWR